ncbi:MAG: hypothetical protein DRO23_12175 [Thermoprotei archaeon]|nr:MAG: hypothetical protein DRO23_12175 [Thermoprotei archaeon]
MISNLTNLHFKQNFSLYENTSTINVDSAIRGFFHGFIGMWNTIEFDPLINKYVMYVHYKNYNPNIMFQVSSYSGSTENIQTFIYGDPEEGDDKIYKYISDDGINWTLDTSGNVIDETENVVTDPILLPYKTHYGKIFQL